MKKSILTLGAAALCGSLLADVSSANTVGYTSFKKDAALNYNYVQGCPFVAVGGSGDSFKLYDMVITGTTALNHKTNYIQPMKPGDLQVDTAESCYWNVTYKQWRYNNASTGENPHAADAVVPADKTYPAGTGFLCRFTANSDKIGLQTSGQVIQPVPDADGYITISRPGASIKYFFVSNPFPVPITLEDIRIAGTSSAMDHRNCYIQYMMKSQLQVDNARAFYVNKATGAKKDKWCYMNGDPSVGAAKDDLVDSTSIVFQPGEGFFCRFNSTGVKYCLKIKVPEAIVNLGK